MLWIHWNLSALRSFYSLAASGSETEYSYGHGISSVILLSIRKNLCSLSLIVIMTDVQNFCDRNSVTIKIKMPPVTFLFDNLIHV
jgi:hypothetical protein